jgi:polysaccharide biosynthesis transport protein
MELRDYVRLLWRWLWLILLGVFVALGATLLALRGEPPQYEARAALLVGQALRQQQPTGTDINLERDLARTYSQIASRRPVREATMQALGMDWLPEYTVRPVPNTQLIEILVIDSDPVRVAAVANELANQLILQTPANTGPEEAQRQGFVRQQLDDLEASISATKAEIARLQEARAGMFSAREIADTQTQITALEQKLRSDQASYGQLLTYMGQGALNVLSLIEPAQIPTDPTGPSKMRTLLMAGSVGLVLALATAFLLDYLDDTVKTPEDVERAMGLTTLAGISGVPGDKPRDRLITIRHPRSPVSEAYRALRTNLQFSSLDKPLRTLVVTSPNPQEGKSTTAANLAVVMAQTGRKVILVDADLRRPLQHRIFGVKNDHGLTDVLLSADLVVDKHLKPTEVDDLHLLNTGPLPPNPSELLGSQRMAALIDQLTEEADMVLFDSPPTLAVTDASVLAAQVDGVLLVVEAGRTRRTLARQTAERMRQVGASLVGAAINRVQPGRGGYYYSYYYYYAHPIRPGRWWTRASQATERLPQQDAEPAAGRRGRWGAPASRQGHFVAKLEASLKRLWQAGVGLLNPARERQRQWNALRAEAMAARPETAEAPSEEAMAARPETAEAPSEEAVAAWPETAEAPSEKAMAARPETAEVHSAEAMAARAETAEAHSEEAVAAWPETVPGPQEETAAGASAVYSLASD